MLFRVFISIYLFSVRIIETVEVRPKETNGGFLVFDRSACSLTKNTELFIIYNAVIVASSKLNAAYNVTHKIEFQ